MAIGAGGSWSEGPRRASLFAGTLVAAAAILLAKWVLLGVFLQIRAAATLLAFAALLALAWVLARRLRLDAGDSALTTAPAVALLLISVVNTPLPFEMESFAERMPHPEGGSDADAVVQRPFRSGHPSARIEWLYGEGWDSTKLTRAFADALESGGWRVVNAVLPDDDSASSFGFVAAGRWDFRATCNVWQAPRTRIACLVTV